MDNEAAEDEGKTRQLEVEHELRRCLESEALLRRLIEESRDGIVILDEQAGVFDANQRFAQLLGYSREELQRLHVWDWDTVYSREQILELAGQVDEQGHRFETRHRRKDGSMVEVELCNNGAFYQGRKLILCICRDISERKQAEQEREELIGQLQASLAEIKTLRGILPICAICKRIRNDKGYWEQVDEYIRGHSQAGICHSICPDCVRGHSQSHPPSR